MRRRNLVTAVATVLLWTQLVSGTIPTPTDHRTVVDLPGTKVPHVGTMAPPDPIYIDVGGDTIGSATAIPGLPYSDKGSTVGYVNDYTPTCLYSSAPDVVYAYAPPCDTEVTISLCGSLYDTALYVYRDVAGNEIGCNDDFCNLQSELQCFSLQGGSTYYIVVDGYGAASGEYVLNVMEGLCPRPVICPPGALLEGEPDCYDGYVDVTNGGCQSVPPVFTELPCGDPGTTTTVCGTYGGFRIQGLDYRDSDWYQIVLNRPSTITWCVQGEYETLCGIVDGNAGCPPTGFLVADHGGIWYPVCVTADLPAGTWWLLVGTYGFGPSAGECGGQYVAELTGHDCEATAAQAATWGRIKGMYR